MDRNNVKYAPSPLLLWERLARQLPGPPRATDTTTSLRWSSSVGPDSVP